MGSSPDDDRAAPGTARIDALDGLARARRGARPGGHRRRGDASVAGQCHLPRHRPWAFAEFHDADYVKIAWTLRVDPIDEGTRCVFCTETRAIATDAQAARKFRRYWALASPGISLIRRLGLPSLKATAERAAATAAPSPQSSGPCEQHVAMSPGMCTSCGKRIANPPASDLHGGALLSPLATIRSRWLSYGSVSKAARSPYRDSLKPACTNCTSTCRRCASQKASSGLRVGSRTPARRRGRRRRRVVRRQARRGPPSGGIRARRLMPSLRLKYSDAYLM